jgi:hypothetical protein
VLAWLRKAWRTLATVSDVSDGVYFFVALVAVLVGAILASLK